MKHLELFAGIGGFRQAFDLISKDRQMVFESIGYSEIDKNACKTYCTNYKPNNAEIAIGDIVSFTSNKSNIIKLPDFDLLSGGFPCQTFSVMGEQKGFNEERGQMFFRIVDIIKIKRPNYLLLENVKNLYTHDGGKTFATIKKELERQGYSVFSDIFNTCDFHLPQKRNRVIIFATRKPISKSFVKDFTAYNIKEHFEAKYKGCSTLHFNSVCQLLKKNVDTKYFLSDKIKPTILSDGSANFKSKSDINQVIARPLTATMHKMHRACQDNYYSQDFIDSHGKNNPVLTHTKEELAKLPIRRITPEEAFQLQGFPASFATQSRKNGCGEGALYKQAGNAVSVNVIYAIVDYLIDKGVLA